MSHLDGKEAKGRTVLLRKVYCEREGSPFHFTPGDTLQDLLLILVQTDSKGGVPSTADLHFVHLHFCQIQLLKSRSKKQLKPLHSLHTVRLCLDRGSGHVLLTWLYPFLLLLFCLFMTSVIVSCKHSIFGSRGHFYKANEKRLDSRVLKKTFYKIRQLKLTELLWVLASFGQVYRSTDFGVSFPVTSATNHHLK